LFEVCLAERVIAPAGKRETCVMGKRKRTREREPADGTRTVRLQELIREEVNFMLRSEVRDPRLEGVVVTMVELAGDGSRARLWYGAADDDDKTEACERVAGFIRVRLAESLGLKRTPELRFRRDPASRLFGEAMEGEL
jgi:ribosome-binding factor A